MSSPQLENGYIRIANELYQAMYKANLSASELRILHFIVYQTFGYNKKSRRLSLSYIANGTGIPIRTVRRSLKNLIDRCVVFSEAEYQNETKILSINKKYTQWRPSKNGRTDRPKMTGQKWTDDTSKNGRTDRPKMDTKTIQNKQDRKNKTESVCTPTKEAAILYFSEHGYSEEVANDFFNYYDALGWKIKGTQILRWEVFADRWMKTEYKDSDDDPALDSWGNPIKSDEWE